ncbi:hypothetical protein K5D34_25515 [Pseudomonas cichorii]|nr:hypothetical protein [Pseudomonas cichorii]MBX8493269.1 hypothetical protein [Pseudomonas cichorii]MBX8513052.1 hypothetical protein [Pseudomonas cichorii]MBX8523035.1 hypothetical protein [Pseudomonas cichorii]MBX8528017.1 hypothetical protein [Pseudomonas cichorii]MBX8538029.1 hypothetical protein [Pseudomonas cichorii]
MSTFNNTKTSALSGDSQQALLTWLQQNPKTLGWDAVVVYNRGRANALLTQQYIKKLTADNYLTPIDGQIGGQEGEKLNFFGIQLGLPRLSFENADIEHSKARITQAITAGLAILKSEPVGGYKGIHSIMRPNGAAGPTLWMDVDLLDAPGDVTDAGVVQIDLTKMTNFDTDLFSDRVSIINAQEFFLERFKEKPELQVYTLGSLNQSADSTLTPQHFIIRTQAAPNAQLRGAPNYGDGAVVLLVTLKGGTDGGAPTKNSDFRYLIPNDENGTKYSSAVVLSNRALFSKLILPTLNQHPTITYKLESPTSDDGIPLHIYAQALSKDYIKPSGALFQSSWGEHHSTLRSLENAIIKVTPDGQYKGLRFVAFNNTLRLEWSAFNRSKWNQKVDVNNGGDTDVDGNFDLTIDLNSDMSLELDPETGIISFSIDESANSHVQLGPFDWLEFFGFDNRSDFLNTWYSDIDQHFFDYVDTIRLPDIDTFLLRNLLFPDNNSMVLTDAHIPGDLAIFGNVDPSLTSFVIEPERVILNPGSTQAFNVEPAATVTWSVQGLPGESLPVGSIDNQGLYTAPTRDDLQGREAQQVIITATGTTARGIAASSSTLVSIVSQTISVNPIFSVAGPGVTLNFTAGALDDRPLNWALKDPGQGGTVEPATGLGVTYTAPAASAGMFTLEVLQVTDDQGNMGQADVLVINKTLGGQVEVDLGEAANGTAQLQFMKQYDEGPIAVPPDMLSWSLLAGPGSIDPVGLYTEPQQKLASFCVITCAFSYAPFPGAPTITDYGYTVLPLPLAQYPDVKRVYQ